MYRLATMHSVTDGLRQTACMIAIADHTAAQYDRQKNYDD